MSCEWFHIADGRGGASAGWRRARDCIWLSLSGTTRRANAYPILVADEESLTLNNDRH